MARPGWHSRGYLPHCNEDGLVQHVVFRLADSLPAAAIHKMALLDKVERYSRCDLLLDAGRGEGILKRPEAAQIVVDTLLCFDGQRYALIAWRVMPNHVHVVVEPRGEHLLGQIVKSWKAFSAARINELTERAGRLWARDYFDRFSDRTSTWAQPSTTLSNPVAAGLCGQPHDWPFSSAAARREAQ